MLIRHPVHGSLSRQAGRPETVPHAPQRVPDEGTLEAEAAWGRRLPAGTLQRASDAPGRPFLTAARRGDTQVPHDAGPEQRSPGTSESASDSPEGTQNGLICPKTPGSDAETGASASWTRPTQTWARDGSEGQAGKVAGPRAHRGSACACAPVAEPDSPRPRGRQEHPVGVSDRLRSPEQSQASRLESRNEPPKPGARGPAPCRAGAHSPSEGAADPTGSWFPTHGARRLGGR